MQLALKSSFALPADPKLLTALRLLLLLLRDAAFPNCPRHRRDAGHEDATAEKNGQKETPLAVTNGHTSPQHFSP